MFMKAQQLSAKTGTLTESQVTQNEQLTKLRGDRSAIQKKILKMKDECAGINRHAAEDERALQERSSEPPGLESCGGSREAAVEA